MTADELLERARSRLERLEPSQADASARDGRALPIDIRSETQLARDGLVPGALVVPRNALEWRCDPASPHRDPRIDGVTKTLIVICDEGAADGSRVHDRGWSVARESGVPPSSAILGLRFIQRG